MRLQIPSAVAVTNTRIFEVSRGAKVNLRHTRLLLVTLPPGTGAQALPVQYCTSKFRSPYNVNVVAGVGSIGDWKLSWTENTSTSLRVFVPLKSTSSQSGKVLDVPSFQKLASLRSPLIALAGCLPLIVEEASARPPLEGNATLV